MQGIQGSDTEAADSVASMVQGSRCGFHQQKPDGGNRGGIIQDHGSACDTLRCGDLERACDTRSEQDGGGSLVPEDNHAVLLGSPRGFQQDVGDQ